MSILVIDITQAMSLSFLYKQKIYSIWNIKTQNQRTVQSMKITDTEKLYLIMIINHNDYNNISVNDNSIGNPYKIIAIIKLVIILMILMKILIMITIIITKIIIILL